MDFFAHQDGARRRTRLLVILFTLAVLLTIVSAYAVVVAVLLLTAGDVDWAGDPFHPGLLLAVGGGTLAIVGGGSLYKVSQLRAGGSVVALMLGGRPVDHDTADWHERRLLNIVEEMAIASGTPVPEVYVLEHERGINAFAAGHTPADAVVGVTRGAIEQLTRDQLQGVIAHEFSHILNGDMRLNLRIIGVVHGILVLGLIGYYILRVGAHTGGRRRKDGVGAVMLIGLGLMVVGFVGTFFGTLIKAAVSRQREYLADASAVQFTRNPSGIAGALRRIGGYSVRARLASPSAPEASHLFFARAVESGLHGLFATHPPLAQRIRRIDPSWDGTWLTRPPDLTSGEGAPESKRSPAATGLIAAAAGTLVASVGAPTRDHAEHARLLLQRVPDEVLAAAREPFGARAAVLLLLRSNDPRTQARQRRALEHDLPLLRLLDRLASHDLDPAVRLPLIDVALPALRRLSPRQAAQFLTAVTAFATADERLDVHEWALLRVLSHHLAAATGSPQPQRFTYYGLARLAEPCSVLLSAVARSAGQDDAAVQRAFMAGAARLDVPGVRLLDPDRCTPERLDRAIDTLASVAPKARRPLIEALAACVTADGAVRVEEAELLRALADALGCPMPPILPDVP